MADEWWHSRKEELLALACKGSPVYVYNEETLNDILFDLLSSDALDVLFYPLHANSHPKVLERVCEMDAGFTCISWDEVIDLLENYPKPTPHRIMFDPGHAYDGIFGHACYRGDHVLVNDLCALEEQRGVVKDREVFIFMKIGHEQGDAGISTLLKDTGMGPGANHEKDGMDIPELVDYLEAVRDASPQSKLCLELPVHMISHIGVLLAEVTDTFEREGFLHIGINMDTKVSIHEGLHGARHKIVDLSKLDEKQAVLTRITALDRGPANSIAYVKRPASVEKGDIILFSDMGTHGPGRNLKDKGRDLPSEHYLRARRLCQVRI